jgi:hypothetical protein
VETKEWKDFELVGRTFLNEWPRSDRRPRMDLYGAVANAAQGRRDVAMTTFNGLISGDTFADVKADAAYYAGMVSLETGVGEPLKALAFFEKSVGAFPTDRACLDRTRRVPWPNELAGIFRGATRASSMKPGRSCPASSRILQTKNRT